MDGSLPSWSAFGTMVEEDAQTDLKLKFQHPLGESSL